MATDADIAEEDMELYGEPLPDDVPATTAASQDVAPEPIKTEVLASAKAELSPHPEALAEAPVTEEAVPLGTEMNITQSTNGATKTEAAQKLAKAEPSDVAHPDENAGEQEASGAKAVDKEGLEDEAGEGGEKDSDGNGNDDDEKDDEEEEEEDSDDDDFDVILNYDDTEAQAKQPNASFGSIGKVRLPANKWQRPGYVPPERVIGVPTQGAARTGGVLAMLPTPTMQIGGSQKSVYDLEIGKLTEKPWLDRNADQSDYFNYGFNEETWKLYCERQKQMRLEASMLAKIKTVDGTKNQPAPANRGTPQVTQKPAQGQQNGSRAQASGGVSNRGGQSNMQQQVPPPPPGMIPPLPGFKPPPGGLPPPLPPGMPKMPNRPNMPKMPGMPPNMPPFPFPPGAANGKGGTFQLPFQPFPMPGGQRGGDVKGNNMFPFLPPPGMPGMPPPGLPLPPGGLPPGMGRGSNNSRGFPGQMQTPQKLQQQSGKNGKSSPSRQGPQDGSHGGDQKRQAGQGHQGSRFSNAQGNQSRSHGSSQQGGRSSHHEGNRRQRWGDRGHGERRQGYDRQSSDRGSHSHGGDRSRTGYDDRGYGDRGHDRRRWGDRDDGQDRRRGSGYDNQRYSERREYDRDRDRDRDYRKRSSSGRDYDEDRKRSRR